MTFKVSSRLLKAGLVTAAFVFMAAPSVSFADALYRELSIGMSGSDVSALQTFLAQDTTLYPQGLVTGYFGSFTRTAVMNFQARNDISTVGRVGPITLAVLNRQMSGGTSAMNGAPIITAVTMNAKSSSTLIGWNTNESAKGVVFYSTTPLTVTESARLVVVTGSKAMLDESFRTAHSVSISNLKANTTYHYLIHTTDQTGNVSISWPSTFKTTD